MRYLAGLILLALAAAVHAGSKPNIVIILADDLGYGDVRCYNPERSRIATPRIDRLASDGMRFTDGHSSSGVCSPSRYALLTGRYHWRTGRAGIVGEYGAPMIASNRLTVAALLQQQGYRTAAIGKWHLGWDWPRKGSGLDFTKPIRNGPTTRGFHHYFGTDVPNWPPFCFIEQDRTVGIPREPLPKSMLDPARHLASKPGPAVQDWQLEEILPELSKRACRFIRDAAAAHEPFLLYLPLTSPHTPIAPSPEWKGRSGFNAYADFVGQTDAVVGEVLDAIAAAGVVSNTLVWFTSDNGCAPYIGAREMEAKGHYPSGPLRGYKGEAWEGGHRVPFILRWPELIPAGSVCTQLVHQADVLATVADILDLSLPSNVGEDSFSLLPLLRDPGIAVREDAVSQAANGTLAFRVGGWKLIAGRGNSQDRLYRLDTDLGEQNDLASAETQQVAQLRVRLERLIRNGRSNPGEPQTNDAIIPFHQLKPGRAP